jgi:hypothetical protein
MGYEHQGPTHPAADLQPGARFIAGTTRYRVHEIAFDPVFPLVTVYIAEGRHTYLCFGLNAHVMLEDTCTVRVGFSARPGPASQGVRWDTRELWGRGLNPQDSEAFLADLHSRLRHELEVSSGRTRQGSVPVMCVVPGTSEPEASIT